MKTRKLPTFLAAVLVLSGCMASKAPPRSFLSYPAPGWSSIEIREGVEFDRAWQVVNSILVRDFDLALVEKGIGYVRTNWLYSWPGQELGNYRVRVTVKFSDGRDKIEIKPEAKYFDGKKWIQGTDNRLISTLNTDLMGTIGRTIR